MKKERDLHSGMLACNNAMLSFTDRLGMRTVDIQRSFPLEYSLTLTHTHTHTHTHTDTEYRY